MALSNIFREPRREITESIIGISTVVGVLAIVLPADFVLAMWFEYLFGEGWPLAGEFLWSPDMWLGMIIGPVVAVGVLFIVGIFFEVTHELGEALCGRLDRIGVRLRPINRR